jgi:pimeloyl-ACP methyl ester carboxylesterase
MRRRIRSLLIAIGSILFLAVIGFVVWGETPARTMPAALLVLNSDNSVTVTDSRWLAFTPAAAPPETGLILYPGGRVDYRAYAPAAHEIASNGFLVVIVPMPLNLAVFGVNTAQDVIAAYPQIHHWAIGGHSLGGSMAANFAKSHPADVAGLVLWASYPASSDDLSASGLKVASISASLDGLATPAKIAASRPLLPADTVWTVIEGGDHAQFGWYGPQAGDNPATISRSKQQSQLIKATIDLLDTISKP